VLANAGVAEEIDEIDWPPRTDEYPLYPFAGGDLKNAVTALPFLA